MATKNCINCKKPVKQTEGKRERKYCSNSCKTEYWNKNKPKPEKKKERVRLIDNPTYGLVWFNKDGVGRPATFEEIKEAWENVAKSLQNAPDTPNLPSNEKPKETVTGKEPAKNSLKTNDSANLSPIIDKAAKIKAFQEELATVPDIGLGKQRRKWIEKQIADLKAGR